MDLGITIPHARGRKAAVFEHSYSRDIDEGDILLLSTAPPLGSETPSIKKIRNTHHKLAQLLAQGTPAVEVSAIMGYSQSRISILQKDPAFKNLLSYYGDMGTIHHVDVVDRLKNLAIDVIEEMQERLEDQDNPLSNNELHKFGEFAADRAGFGAKQTLTINHGIDQVALEQLKSSIENSRGGNVIEATENLRLDNGGGDSKPSGFLGEEAQVEYLTAKGDLIPAAGGEISLDRDSRQD